MLRNMLSSLLPLAFTVVAFSSHVAAGNKPDIYPSSKYPDFPFSEAVAYGGVLYLSGDIGTGTDGKLVEGGFGFGARRSCRA
jgi:enamine deaminase RidA (YjgF/YER057c/UK114 family)